MLHTGVGEVSSLIHDFSAAKIVADEKVKRRVASAVDACDGINAVLADIEELIAQANAAKPEAAITVSEP